MAIGTVRRQGIMARVHRKQVVHFVAMESEAKTSYQGPLCLLRIFCNHFQSQMGAPILVGRAETPRLLSSLRLQK